MEVKSFICQIILFTFQKPSK